MSQVIEVKVPDIGDFKDVPIIELCVKAGDTVNAEDALVTLESDKATIDIPSPAGGVIKELKVNIGDKVSEGSLIAVLEAADAASPSAQAPASAPTQAPATAAPAAATTASSEVAAPPAAPQPGQFAGKVDLECEMLVLGAGPGGYSAAFRAADLGMKTVIVERYSTLGGVCLNVGCIPSKALLHIAVVMDEAEHMADCGVSFAAPQIDIDKLRAHKSGVVGKLTGGLAGMAKARKVEVVRGYGSFLDANHIEVETTEGAGQTRSGEKKVIRFQKCIIAAGSAAVHLPFIPSDPRIVDSTGALELRMVNGAAPKKMLVIGGGIIGLEMATVYSLLGTRVDVVEMLDALMQGPDRDAVKVWEKQNLHRFDRVMLKTKTVAVEVKDEGLEVKFEGEGVSPEPVMYDMILQAAGRSPNGGKIAADKAGVIVTDRGFITVDKQMRTNVPHIFAIGDIVGQPMLAHKGVHEGHVAAEVAAGELKGDTELARTVFDAQVIPSVAYTHPEVAWVGYTEDQAKKEGRKIEVARFPWAASGRAIANGADYGFTKLLFDSATHRIIGGAIVGPSAGDMISEVCLAIEMGCDAIDIGKTIHPHPTLGETVGMAAEVAHGSCTDIPPVKKKK
ncbi:Pyruvate dehydrogenase multienzyme complex, Dihydrolipoamide dehydrogenase component [Candidatus Propionivibrio aalborgensis]|uniref:Dihydrolipoyl dehydrogenase n=1 Tax=Candidatus Propionivibrio aalborgensis TaxID=1860101 RepID=A0A1A8XNK7_9RHOO|nr:dihydrolipoyl dehydrogenase [Candidatus Propionivibrio aalborgensis]SBT05538.1 Pyruvate dehydrogenase multienzyme complex, Dihydrolipoamide dehydrogenase component [Candidatus Propionivibrio aalborgensis]